MRPWYRRLIIDAFFTTGGYSGTGMQVPSTTISSHGRHLQPDGCNFFSTEGTSAGGSGINMTNQKLSRILATFTLAALLTAAVGSEVHAARRQVFTRPVSSSSVSAPKPSAGPLAGEP